MIELRWLETRIIGADGRSYRVAITLQTRESEGKIKDFYGSKTPVWGKWKDVPVVDAENAEE